MIYLDYQATTPVAPEVVTAMEPWISEKFANPHSPSRWGREAEAAIEVARKDVLKSVGLGGGSIAFTGNATEALNWALKGTVEKAPRARNRIITVATEHAAVRDTCEWLAGQGADLTILPVRNDGILDLELLERELDERALVVAVMLVNNEIGVLQPISEIAKMAHEAGALMLCDAVQALGRVDIAEGPDLVAVSAHKIHGPKGIGALWMRKGAEPAPFMHGGGQERGLRSGTLSPALCVGFGAAAKLASERINKDYDHGRRPDRRGNQRRAKQGRCGSGRGDAEDAEQPSAPARVQAALLGHFSHGRFAAYALFKGGADVGWLNIRRDAGLSAPHHAIDGSCRA